MGKPAVSHLNWRVGCGTFGHLITPAGSRELIETLWFSEQEAAVVLLASGDRQIVACKKETTLLSVVAAEAACAEVGIPLPGRIKVAGEWRRVDPFHSERHTSARFRALTGLIRERRLPCRYSLLHFALGEGVGEWGGPCVEDPEQTAANVAERLARERGLPLAEALHAELLGDALCAVETPDEAQQLLDRAGWSALFANLERELPTVTSTLPPPGTRPPAAGDSQLALFEGGTSDGRDQH
jgi:hypothetical protein